MTMQGRVANKLIQSAPSMRDAVKVNYWGGLVCGYFYIE